jgi:uncharacterized protein
MLRFVIGIVITLVLLLLFSKWKLWLGVLAGALTFGIINLEITEIGRVFARVLADVETWFLVLAVGMIPVLGAIIRGSIHLESVLSRLRTKKKLYLMITPAMFGLLPIPGGALISCPLLKDFDKDISPERYVAINIWFRHLLVIVYPLSSSLIIASQLAGLSITTAIAHMFPFTLIMFLLGYWFIMSGIKNEELPQAKKMDSSDKKDVAKLAVVLLTAPFLHILLSLTLLRSQERFSFFVSMIVSVVLAMIINKISLKSLLKIARTSKIEQFSLLFLFLLFFIAIIRSYEHIDTIFSGFHPPMVLIGVLAFALSYASGRIEIALSIIYPLIFAAHHLTSFSGFLFSFIYYSLFAGYLLSPLHPCMAFSLEYFGCSYGKVNKILFPLVLIPFIVVAAAVFFLY